MWKMLHDFLHFLESKIAYIFLSDQTLQNTIYCNCGGVALEDRLRFSIEEEAMDSFEEKHDSECVVLVRVL